jgi:hypothetical protein
VGELGGFWRWWRVAALVPGWDPAGGFFGARVRCWKGGFSEGGRVRAKGDFTDHPRKIEAATVVGWVVDWGIGRVSMSRNRGERP